MAEHEDPPYGVRTISWPAIHDLLYPLPPGEYDYGPPHGDEEAAEMQRLRGLVIIQHAETEAVLGQLYRLLEPSPPKRPLMAGALRIALTKLLTAEQLVQHAERLALIESATAVRNRAVHSTVQIHYARDHPLGGTGWMSVLSVMGDEETDESDLQGFLALQQRATTAAVEMYQEVSDSLPPVVGEPSDASGVELSADWFDTDGPDPGDTSQG
ncbi:hypothetical protein [Cryptosporangium sp. NPDC048952]|uniref:hypothetical protein n=1 Tax=Cryptosporangium sp. NPDC048952 TaxID=3363961 RepID=UPI0037227DF7